nr:pentapeptide repeat-containing protein [Nitrosomonas nitrosa]
MAEAYFHGRAAGALQSPFKGSNQLFAGQRLDGQIIASPTYEHCTFANVSFKEAKLEGGRFVNCVFVACFFRKTDIRSCNFSSCRFINCEFPGASFSGCDVRYTRFVGCYIPVDDIEHNLPSEPNLREHLSRNLAREAALLGDPHAARRFRLLEVRAREANGWAAVIGKTKYYRDHYNVRARFTTLVRLVGSVLNRVLFGYSERLWVLVRNFALATFLLFPGLYFFSIEGLSGSTVTGTPVQQSPVWAAFEFSVKNAVVGALASQIDAVTLAVRAAAAVQIVLTAIWASLVASYLFRWSLQR